MKAKFKRSASVTLNAGFQIAPMIDVVFVIMLFFMVMAGAAKRENALNMRLPGEPWGDRLSLPDEIAIRVDDEGQVYLNDDPQDSNVGKALPELTGTLKEIKSVSDAVKSKLLVTVYADELATYGRVIDVLDSLSLAQISDVTFQAASPE